MVCPVWRRLRHGSGSMRFIIQGTIMSKIKQTNKEPKKQPALTPKEKKTAKQAKKQATGLLRPAPR